MAELVDKLQTQLFQLHSLHVKLEALLESVLIAKLSPQLSIHVLESRRHPQTKSNRARVCIRIASEGRRFNTRDVLAEKGQTAFSWMETFSFPVEALDGDVRLYILEKVPGTETIQGTSSVRLSKLLDQDRHDFWCVVEKAEVRLAIRLVHSPEICYKHALQQVKTKIAKTEMLLLSCTLDTEKVDEGIERLERELDLTAAKEAPDCLSLALKVYQARCGVSATRLNLSLRNKAAEVLLRKVDDMIEKKKNAAQVILRAYRRYKTASKIVTRTKSKFFDIHSSESVSFEEDKYDFWKDGSDSELQSVAPREETAPISVSNFSQHSGELEQLAISASEKSPGSNASESHESSSESDEEGINYYDPSTANRFNRLRGLRR